ncbi:unnamed protein product [Rhizophagus irregularis]|nr:unnamed protein product [Rhizophagus irregularis]CAB4428598.1 unnamed protein product [Rhizophagus irregularis]
MIYKNGRASKKVEREKTKMPDTQTPVDQPANISMPLTPSDRMYMELANMPVKKYNAKKLHLCDSGYDYQLEIRRGFGLGFRFS